MSITIPAGMPRLAKGNHPRGSGHACVMNYLSYLNGDATITDHPTCTHPALASAAIWLNDTICYTSPDVLCSECTGILLRFASRLFGTGEVGVANADRIRISRGLIAWMVARYPLAYAHVETDVKKLVAAYGSGLIDWATFCRLREKIHPSSLYGSRGSFAGMQAMTMGEAVYVTESARDVVMEGLPRIAATRTDAIDVLDGLLTAYERLARREAPYEISPAEQQRIVTEIGDPAAYPNLTLVLS